MSGKLQNMQVLTKDFLVKASGDNKSISQISDETGVNSRTVFNYLDKFGLLPESEDEKLLRQLHTKAQHYEDMLQRAVLDIDLLKMKMERNGEMFDMAKITRLATKLRDKDAVIVKAYDRIAAEG